ncbi:hypothetical protein ABT026_18915 [Streptomyces sp. NPDC002734]|uniref:hypothetical protein n=1 Tax=Streptomyces sp. NPDC002734 TaxID=3154426 RepID=UPI003318B222
MIRTRQLALALLAPFLVTGCVAVTPNAPRPPRDAATAAVSRPAVEQTAPRQDRGELVESGERKRRAKKEREKAGGRSRAGEGTRVRTQGRGEPATGRPRPRAEIRSGSGIRSGAPGTRRHGFGRPRPRAEQPRARMRPAPRPRRHDGHGGFRMGEWCRQARGVASSDVVSLCHRAYGR